MYKKKRKKMISSQREINQRQREITEHVCRRTFTELSINRSLASRRDIQGRKSKDDVGISRYRYTRERKREGGRERSKGSWTSIAKYPCHPFGGESI